MKSKASGYHSIEIESLNLSKVHTKLPSSHSHMCCIVTGEATNTFKPSKTPTLNYSSSIQKTPVVTSTSTGGPSTTAVPTPSPFVTQSSPHSPTPYLYLLPAMSVVIISVCALVSVLVFFGMRRYRDHKKKW